MMKTVIETIIETTEGSCIKSFVAKKSWKTYNDLNYAMKKWPNLSPSLKEKYFRWMVNARIIKEDEYTPEALFSYK